MSTEQWLLLGFAAWVIISIPVALFVGACIAVGDAASGETEHGR